MADAIAMLVILNPYQRHLERQRAEAERLARLDVEVTRWADLAEMVTT